MQFDIDLPFHFAFLLKQVLRWSLNYCQMYWSSLIIKKITCKAIVSKKGMVLTFDIGMTHTLVWGSNMIFHSLTFARSRGRCWKPRANPEVFNISRGTLWMLMNDKIMFDRYYHINSKKTHRILRKCLHTLFFSLFINILDLGRGQVLFLKMIWRRYFCCGALLLLVLAVRIYTLVQLLC